MKCFWGMLVLTFCLLLFGNHALAETSITDFSELFENHGSVMLVIDVESGDIVAANNAASEFYGYPKDLLKNMKIQEINSLSQMEIQREIDAAASQKRNYFLFAHKLANGDIRNVEVYSYPFISNDRQMLYSIIHDVTPRVLTQKMLKQRNIIILIIISILAMTLLGFIAFLKKNLKSSRSMSALLEKSNSRLQNLFNNMQECFAIHEAIFDKDGKVVDYRFIDVNKAFEQNTGLKRENIINRTVLEVLPQTEYYWIEKYGQVATTGVQMHYENYSKEIDKYFSVNVYSPEQGFFATLFSDITDKVVTESINESIIKILQNKTSSVEEYLDNTLNEVVRITGSKIGYIYLYDHENKQFILNSWSKEVMKECAVVEKKTVYQLEKTGIWGEAVRQGKPVMVNDYEAPNTMKKGCPEGHVKLSRFLTIPVYYNNIIVAVVGVANKEKNYTNSDIFNLTIIMENAWEVVKRLQAEAELIEAKNRAEAANVAKTQFLANMSHEIRTPMNGILGFLSLLEETGLSEEQKDYLEYIRSSTNNLLTVINDILDISRIEAGRAKMNNEIFNIYSIVRETVLFHTPKANEKGLSVNFNIGQGVPEDVEGDHVKLRQILSNLISNAVKFTPSSGSINVVVEISKEYDKLNSFLELVFTVEDTGIGIEKDDLARLFQPFSQVDMSDTRKYGGTGLGLYICKKLVNMMDGNISMESEPGRGTKVTFTVRMMSVNDGSCDMAEDYSGVNAVFKDTCRETAAVHVPGMAENMVKPRMLLVEDDTINQKFFIKLLESYGFNCDIAANGQEAVQACGKNKYDIIFMDMQMPVMSGYEAVRHIRHNSLNSDTFIIAMTAYAMSGDREKCIDAGMDEYLSKPVVPEAVMDIIMKATQKKL